MNELIVDNTDEIEELRRQVEAAEEKYSQVTKPLSN